MKAPKVHVVDSGLASTLVGLQAADWLTNLDRFGHILESFVVQQLIAQGGWTDAGLRRLAEQCGPSFRGGMILYGGTSTFAMADKRVFAVPLGGLWSK